VKRKLKIHPVIISHARNDARSKAFIDTMFQQLASPLNQAHTPAPRMFEERYSYFEGNYEWVA
jgi:hypothetical protein